METEYSVAAVRLLHEAKDYAQSDDPALRERVTEVLLAAGVQALVHIGMKVADVADELYRARTGQRHGLLRRIV